MWKPLLQVLLEFLRTSGIWIIMPLNGYWTQDEIYCLLLLLCARFRRCFSHNGYLVNVTTSFLRTWKFKIIWNFELVFFDPSVCVHKHAHMIICELHITKYFYYWLIFVSVDFYIFKVISLGVQQISFQGNSVSSSV